jgi:DNA polymerase I-like protein with 3'-5' exonuclease and polymerase domains
MVYLVTNRIELYDITLYKPISIEESIHLLENLEEISIDTETSGLDCYTKDILLIQLGSFDFQILYDISSFQNRIPKVLINFLNQFTGLFIGQNIKFDWKFLFKHGILLKNVYDTMLAEIIITNGLQFDGRDLGTIVEKYCGIVLKKEIRGQIITKGLSDAVLLYGADDIKYLSKVKKMQLKIAEELKLLNAINLDNSFVVVLSYVEYCGIKLDYLKWRERTLENIEKSLKIKKSLERLIYNDGKYKYFSGMLDLYTGERECVLNWDSPKQVIELFSEYGINTKVYDKGEEKQTIDAKVLEPQKEQFPILPLYLDYKTSQKLVSTYGLNWHNFINSKTGRIHASFKQLMDTSRLSCGSKRDNSPNLQNLPSDELTRSCFIAEKNNKIAAADFSSQEQIVLANASKESNLLNFYKQGFKDMHSYIAFLMYPDIRKCELEELKPDSLNYIKNEFSHHRKLAKNAGFAINYGGNGTTIAKNCNIPKAEGDFVYDSYFKAFPKLKEYFELGFKKVLKYHWIEFNPVTKRKYLFNKTNDFFALKEEVEDPFFWIYAENARDKFRKYNKAKGDIQRISQNYPIQGE